MLQNMPELLQSEKCHILALDLGTTNLRSIVYKKDGQSLGCVKRMNINCNTADQFYLSVLEIIKAVIQESNITVQSIASMGISVQRNTFLLWDRKTGEVKTDLISWTDLSSEMSARYLNNCVTHRLASMLTKFAHFVSHSERMCAVATFEFKTVHVSTRLYHLLHNDSNLMREAKSGQLMFGCLETWLLWKLTHGQMFATDIGCASATGLYDAFQKDWSSYVLWLLQIPSCILPNVLPTSGYFGDVHESQLGASIPIHAIVGDQMAATFGACCFDTADMKVTLGTGIFANVHCGFTEPLASFTGWSPLIGWQLPSATITYLVENSHADCGTVIEWLKLIGFFHDYDDLENKLQATNGKFDDSQVFFMPYFNGVLSPICNSMACSAFLGLRANTNQAEMLHAALQSIAFVLRSLLSSVQRSHRRGNANSISQAQGEFMLHCPLYAQLVKGYLRINGNVSKSNWLMQEIADVLQRPVQRCERPEITCLGAAMLAGCGLGLFSSKEDLLGFAAKERHYEHSECAFFPNTARASNLELKYKRWFHARTRTFDFYKATATVPM